MKNATMLIITAITILAFTPLAKSVNLDGVPADLREKLENRLATRYPPELKSIKLNPASPTPGEPVEVTAVVQNDASVTEDETSNVYLMYSTDNGETWNQIELDQQNDNKTWKGEIPGQEKNTEVIYGIRAVDSSANFYTDVPCQTPEPPYHTENYLDKSCVGDGPGRDLTKCEGIESELPIGCMAAMARDENPLDDADAEIPKYLDLLDYRVGYDDHNIYIELVTEKEQSDGTLSPMDIRVFAVAIINPDKSPKGANLDELLATGKVALHAPLAIAAGGIEGSKPCSLVYQKGNGAYFDDENMKCSVKGGNHLFLTIKRSGIGDNPSNQLIVLPVNGIVTRLSPFDGKVGDYAHWTTLDMQPRSYKVQ